MPRSKYGDMWLKRIEENATPEAWQVLQNELKRQNKIVGVRKGSKRGSYNMKRKPLTRKP